MGRPAIRIENLGKRYLVDHERKGARGGYRTLRESIAEAAMAPLKRLSSKFKVQGSRWGESAERGARSGEQANAEGRIQNSERPRKEEFWALKDVSFEVQPGEVVGIIGRNGAGKSTLLKILSQITKPTTGRVELNGRVGSLLEVGTGFHPELTGRENIYLNGSILGMSKREIDRKFDEIVDFAEVEKFLDTPVKRYSSGMYVRLAFAVAAHLEPEILIIDEVLAVGDSAFQRKCIRKMDDVARKGRTILFVSHSLATIRTFCKTACFLRAGRLANWGEVNDTVNAYLDDVLPDLEGGVARFDAPEGANIWITQASVVFNGGEENSVCETGDNISFDVSFASKKPIRDPKIGLAICAHDGTPILSTNNRYQRSESLSSAATTGTIRCSLGVVPLHAGKYFVSLWLGDERGDHHQAEYALSFDVLERDIWGTGKVPTRFGYCWWPAEFATR